MLILAALQKVVHKDNASKLKCKIIAEASEGPVTFWGEEIVEKRGIQIIPDLILDSGGVIVSYFEWLKNIQHVEQGILTKRWEEISHKNLYEAITGDTLTKENFGVIMDQNKLRGANEIDIVNSALQEIMNGSLDEQFERSLKHNINIRTASLSSAIDKIGASYVESGILF